MSRLFALVLVMAHVTIGNATVSLSAIYSQDLTVKGPPPELELASMTEAFKEWLVAQGGYMDPSLELAWDDNAGLEVTKVCSPEEDEPYSLRSEASLEFRTGDPITVDTAIALSSPPIKAFLIDLHEVAVELNVDSTMRNNVILGFFVASQMDLKDKSLLAPYLGLGFRNHISAAQQFNLAQWRDLCALLQLSCEVPLKNTQLVVELIADIKDAIGSKIINLNGRSMERKVTWNSLQETYNWTDPRGVPSPNHVAPLLHLLHPVQVQRFAYHAIQKFLVILTVVNSLVDRHGHLTFNNVALRDMTELDVMFVYTRVNAYTFGIGEDADAALLPGMDFFNHECDGVKVRSSKAGNSSDERFYVESRQCGPVRTRYSWSCQQCRADSFLEMYGFVDVGCRSIPFISRLDDIVTLLCGALSPRGDRQRDAPTTPTLLDKLCTGALTSVSVAPVVNAQLALTGCPRVAVGLPFSAEYCSTEDLVFCVGTISATLSRPARIGEIGEDSARSSVLYGSPPMTTKRDINMTLQAVREFFRDLVDVNVHGSLWLEQLREACTLRYGPSVCNSALDLSHHTLNLASRVVSDLSQFWKHRPLVSPLCSTFDE